MHTNTFLKLPIEIVNNDALALPYSFRFNGPGKLYCGWCLHDIRLVCRTKTGVSCADCGQNLDIAFQSFFHEDQE